MSNQKIQVITHTDLDGCVSYLVLCWLYGKKLDIIGTTPAKLEQDFDKLVASGKTWDKLYFLDLDVSKIGEKIDQKTIHQFIEKLAVRAAVKKELKKITPHNYTGIQAPIPS